MKVLQLTYRVPFPPTDGGAIGIYAITKGLHHNNCDIDLLSINTPKHSQPADAMSALATQYDVFVDTKISAFNLIKNVLFESIPYNVERFISENVNQVLQQLLQKNKYDFIQIEGAFVIYYIDLIKKFTNSPILVRTHNIEYVIWQRLAINEKNPFRKWFYDHLAKRLKLFEANFYNKADGIAAITAEDKERLLEMGVTKPIQIIPAGVMLDKYFKKYDLKEKSNTIFSISALDWLPNIEGLEWFLKNVWEELFNINPNIELHIAGKSTPDWLKKLERKNVFIHGFVDDAILFKKSYQLMLVPLLSGGGMRVKIIEGMAAKKCIISSSIGAEGIEYTNKKNIVIADTAKEWVDAILFYLENQNERIEIANNAFELVNTKYENNAITKKYIELFEQVKKKNI